MLNSHQILAGARTKGGIKTYVDADYVVRPEVTVTGSNVTFTGSIEFDGEVFDLTDYDLDLRTVTNLLMDGEYVIGAVPSYIEPASRANAETAGENYYVTTTATGDTQLHYFLPSQLEADMTAAGGYPQLYKARAMGTASNGQIQLLNRYSDELERLSDPRYVGKLLVPTGVEYVLKRITAQDNRSRTDALVGMSNQEIETFIATQGYVAANRRIMTVAEATAAFETTPAQAKVKRAFVYTSEADATADVNGTEVLISDYRDRPDIFSSPEGLDGANINGSHFAIFELYQPTYMSKGHHGTNPAVLDTYTKQDSTVFGRINPIYQARDFEVARVSAGRGMPLPAVTKYGHPLNVARLTKSGNTYTANGGYTPGAFVPAGGPTPTP